MTYPTLLDALTALADRPCPRLTGTLPASHRYPRTRCDATIAPCGQECGQPADATADLADLECLGVRLDQVMDVLIDSLAQLAPACHCRTSASEEQTSPSAAAYGTRPRPQAAGNIVEACLRVFDRCGERQAMSSEDLVWGLRKTIGRAEGRWEFADLTQRRLAILLAPYGVHSQDVTLSDGRRRKAYRRTALEAAARDGRR